MTRDDTSRLLGQHEVLLDCIQRWINVDGITPPPEVVQGFIRIQRSVEQARTKPRDVALIDNLVTLGIAWEES